MLSRAHVVIAGLVGDGQVIGDGRNADNTIVASRRYRASTESCRGTTTMTMTTSLANGIGPLPRVVAVSGSGNSTNLLQQDVATERGQVPHEPAIELSDQYRF